MDIYLPAHTDAATAGIVVLPGGGYVHVSTTREGSDVAKMLVSHGIAAFVVRYRVAPLYTYPIPLWDAQRAMRIVRTNATQYNIDPKRLGVIGFSAGGHLAAMLATGIDPGPLPATDAIDSADAHPNFAILMYPVMTLTQDDFVHKGSRTALTKDDPKIYTPLSPDEHVNSDTPRTFLALASGDRTVNPMNSILYYEACLKNHVPAELHIFTAGGHGFGLAPTDPAIRVWPDLMVSWLAKNKIIDTPKEFSPR
jgi:acetyl esterase/lipase